MLLLFLFNLAIDCSKYYKKQTYGEFVSYEILL